MATEGHEDGVWKRRRRREDLLPTHAKLMLDESLKGDTGILSQALWQVLFRTVNEPEADDIVYIALYPRPAPNNITAEDLDWTIVPVKVVELDSNSPALRFPPGSLVLQGFLRLLKSNLFSLKQKSIVEVLVIDIKPLELTSILLRVDGEALHKHYDVQKRFGGGFLSSVPASSTKDRKKSSKSRLDNKPDGTHSSQGPDQTSRLQEAVRASLGRLDLIHCEDLLPLPMPSHPITHVPFPPAEILVCEPVSQGLISSTTEIFVDIQRNGEYSKSNRTAHLPGTSIVLMGDRIISEEEGDTTDQFYSAAENEGDEDESEGTRVAGADSADDDESGSSDSSSSDESPDNMISLTSPMLPSQASGILSARTAATPRPFNIRGTGANSPGSVNSIYTATTANERHHQGRAFQLKPLVAPMGEVFLHPRPRFDEDDEARIFVDVKRLVRLGCFSGDWVKITTSDTSAKDQLWDAGSFGNDEYAEVFRPAKIYGLPDLAAENMAAYPKNEWARRQSHHSLFLGSRPLPSAYVSPIFFANLGEPSDVTIALLSGPQRDDQKHSKSKVPSSTAPPIARELTLYRVPTPIATERATSAGILASLKDYFESRRRLVQEGDLVAVRIDAAMSRVLSDGGSQLEVDGELEELLQVNKIEKLGRSRSFSKDVAWFKVGRVFGVYADDEPSESAAEIWGAVASAEPMITKMIQAGSEPSKLPSLSTNPWRFFLGSLSYPASRSTKHRTVISPEDLPKKRNSPLQARLEKLLTAALSPQAAALQTEPLAILLHSVQRNAGKTHLVSNVCASLGLHYYPIDSYSILSEGAAGGDVKTEGYLRKKVEFAMSCGSDFTVPLIRHVEALTADRMESAIGEILKEVKVLVFTTTEIEKIPEGLRSLFTHEIEVAAPDEQEREGILHSIVHDLGISLAYDVDLANVALKTAALVAGDLLDVVERAVMLRQDRLEDIAATNPSCLVRDVVSSGGVPIRTVVKADFDTAIDVARKNFADAIGAPKIPNVTWEDVGGLSHVKDAVFETIQLPLERPELFASGMKKRSGILFYGPPGTGKTLVAKAIATEFSLNFFSVKGPELLNMYIGESEANVRRVFQKARDARPCVVFFDELDSVAPKRGNQGDSGGVMDRIVSQLLAELDGMSDGKGGSGGVFVIGATNRPDLLDQALLRPGRFDKMLYLGVSDTHDKQLNILEALTRKFDLRSDLSLRRVAERLPFTYTGADLYALCSDAMLKAISRKAADIDAKIKKLPGGPVTTAQFFDRHATEEDTSVVVSEDDFLAAQKELVSSVRYVTSDFNVGEPKSDI